MILRTRRRVYLALGFVLLLVIMAFMFSLPPFSPSPLYYKNVEGGTKVYGCDSASNGAAEFTVSFSADGHIAKVQVLKQRVTLPFSRDDSFIEEYENGSWQLTLDPEAGLSGPNGLRLTSCN